jgi:adenine/guanine phosphoribosyltransferase-like PRPP-binding protein
MRIGIGELPERVVAEKMKLKGYKFIMVPQNDVFPPLYTKTLELIGELLREYPDTKFKYIVSIDYALTTRII